jgi:hypothetical protein
MATFHADPTELDGPYCSEEKRAPDTIPNMSICKSATQFLSQHNH